MKRYHLFLAFLIIPAVFVSCAFHRAKPLEAHFWGRKNLNIGVALARVPEPSIRVESATTAWPGMLRTGILVRGNREHEDRGIHPQLKSEARTLEGYLKKNDGKVVKEVQGYFVKVLQDAGWRAVAIDEPMKEIDPAAQNLKGLDAVIILDCDWYGMDCHYTDLNQDFTDADAGITGRMVDLASNALLWQSPHVRIRNPVSCRCNEADCFPPIDNALEKAVGDAAAVLLKDLIRNRP